MRVVYNLTILLLQLFENKANCIWLFGSRKGYTPGLAWFQGVSLSLSQVGRDGVRGNRGVQGTLPGGGGVTLGHLQATGSVITLSKQ